MSGKSIGWLVAIISIPFMLMFYIIGLNNGLVTADESVSQTNAQVQNVIQRQADLIPNLVETVKGAAGFERGALTDIIQARNTALRPVILLNGKTCSPVTEPGSKTPKCDTNELLNDPNAQKAFTEAQRALLNINVNALREAYPQLQSVTAFNNLMSQLEGSINRITVERKRNQEAVQDYNRRVRSFPSSMVASYQGYQRRTYFEASADAQRAPVVKFQ